MAAPRKAPGEVFDTYLGMLYPTEDYKVYGYISNTRIKFILVVDEMLQKEDEVRMVSIADQLAVLHLHFFWLRHLHCRLGPCLHLRCLKQARMASRELVNSISFLVSSADVQAFPHSIR